MRHQRMRMGRETLGRGKRQLFGFVHIDYVTQQRTPKIDRGGIGT
jgi:hypothetical protein